MIKAIEDENVRVNIFWKAFIILQTVTNIVQVGHKL